MTMERRGFEIWFTDGQRESLRAMRDQHMTTSEIAMVVTVARLTDKRIGEVAMTFLVARDQVELDGIGEQLIISDT